MGEKTPEKVDYYSQQAIDKAVRTMIFQHPLTLYSIVLGGVGILAALVLKVVIIPNLFFISVGLIGFGFLTFLVNLLFRKKSLSGKYIQKVNHILEKQKLKALESLKRNLARYRSIRSLSVFSKQAAEQFDKIKLKFDSFKKILADKFSSGELTYGRFYGTTEQLYLSVLDNLEMISNLLETCSGIDERYIKKRFKHLEGLEAPTEADKRELDTLNQRKELRDQQLQKINDLLTINEEAMTQMDMSMSAVTDAKTKEGRATMDMETARLELEELIRRTKKYSS